MTTPIKVTMKCPKCKSPDTKRVTSRDRKWTVGAERCQACDYQGHFMEFMGLVSGRKDIVIDIE